MPLYLLVGGIKKMTDQELMAEAPSLPVLFFDGFGAFRKVNGLLRCVGYTLSLGSQANLIISIAGAAEASVEALRVINEDSAKGGSVWKGMTLAH